MDLRGATIIPLNRPSDLCRYIHVPLSSLGASCAFKTHPTQPIIGIAVIQCMYDAVTLYADAAKLMMTLCCIVFIIVQVCCSGNGGMILSLL